MKNLLLTLACIVVIPLAALLLGALASLGWCLVRDRIARETRQLKRDLDAALQREWDLRMQMNAVTEAIGEAEATHTNRIETTQNWSFQ